MDRQLVIELLAILVLVIANGFFALAEFSIISSRLTRLGQKVTQQKWGARRAQKLRSNPDRFLASIQVGITLVAALLGVYSGATIVDRFALVLAGLPWTWLAESATTVSVVLVVLVITILSVVLGELVPKYIALSNPEKYARYMAGMVSLFIRITSPFSRFLSWLANGIVRLLGIKRGDNQRGVNEEEINQMLHDGLKEGVFDNTEQEFVRSVFDFSDSTVRRAITPRPDVVALDKTAAPADVLQTIIEEGYSRYPVYDGTIDNVIGIFYSKDLINPGIDLSRINLGPLLRDPLFVPDSLPLPKLLREFQKGKAHMAVVLDEFGGTAGIITLEDIIEELVGEIQDEYDAETTPIVKHSDSLVYADGDVWPGDVNELLDSQLPEDTHDTLAGLIMEELGRLPEEQEVVKISDVNLTVLAKDKNRILRVKIQQHSRDDEQN